MIRTNYASGSSGRALCPLVHGLNGRMACGEEYALGFHRHDAGLDEPTTAKGATTLGVRDPRLKDCWLVNQRRMLERHSKRECRASRPGDRVGGGEHHVECAGQRRTMHAPRRPLKLRGKSGSISMATGSEIGVDVPMVRS